METMPNKDRFCPCSSGKLYEYCCLPFHNGELPEKAHELMRSRYSAYAKQLSYYIIDTTHPLSPYYQNDKTEWIKDILMFSITTQFERLQIISSTESEMVDGEEIAYVIFKAYLSQHGKNVSFQEKSLFKKMDDKWFYFKRWLIK